MPTEIQSTIAQAVEIAPMTYTNTLATYNVSYLIPTLVLLLSQTKYTNSYPYMRVCKSLTHLSSETLMPQYLAAEKMLD